MILKKSLFLLGLSFSIGLTSSAQTQFVQNSSFENGPVVTNNSQIAHADHWHQVNYCVPFPNPAGYNTADILDRNSTDPNFGVPQNVWTVLNERTNQNRYAHIHALTISGNNARAEEYMVGDLSNALSAGCYNFSVWVAREKISANQYHNPSSQESILKAELVSDLANCPISTKVIYTSSNINSLGWTQLNISFSISAAEAGIYDHIKLKTVSPTASTHEYGLLIDDVEITDVAQVPVSLSANTTEICEGAAYSILTATGGSNYTWSTGANPSSGNPAVAYVYPSATTTYTVTSNSGTCPTSASVTINVVPVSSLVPILSQTYTICSNTGSFPTICLPNASSNVTWFKQGQVGTYYGNCFTPTSPGQYGVFNEFIPTDPVTGGTCAGTGGFFVVEDCPPVPDPCKSLYFDGNDDYLISQTPVLNGIGNDNFTIEARVKGKENNQGSNPMIISNGGASLFLRDHPMGQARMLCLKLGGVDYFLVDNGDFGGSVLDGDCHHVAVSRINEKLVFYIDGQYAGAKEIFGNPSVSGSALNFGRHPSNTNFFEGIIADLRIWNIFKEGDEIKTDMDVSFTSQQGLYANFELNSHNGQVTKNTVDPNFSAQLGSTLGSDINDPKLIEECCNVSVSNRREMESNTESMNNSGSDLEKNQLSTSRKLLHEDITVYPNPTNGVFNVQIENIDNSVIKVVNALGKTILIQNVNRNLTSINLTSQPNGVYFVMVVSNETTEVKKVIKN